MEIDDPAALNFLKEINSRFIPNQVVLWAEDSRESSFLKDKERVDGKATAYVCRNYACRLPVTDLKKLKELLDQGESNAA